MSFRNTYFYSLGLFYAIDCFYLVPLLLLDCPLDRKELFDLFRDFTLLNGVAVLVVMGISCLAPVVPPAV
jgi:hypothetical protein